MKYPLFTSFHHSLWFLSLTKWAKPHQHPLIAPGLVEVLVVRGSRSRETPQLAAHPGHRNEAAVDSKVHCHLKESHLSNYY
jgi:hypothetical protein